MLDEPIKVFLVEDSPVVLSILQRLLEEAPGLQVVGTARNGVEALEKIPAAQPQIICTDLWMDRMDGMELIKRAMADYPCPILVISQAVQEAETVNRLKAIGAVDVFQKPAAIETAFEPAQALIQKIKVVSGVTVFTRPLKRRKDISAPLVKFRKAPVEVVTLGLSTGGPRTMQVILANLPRNFPVPILCTQHISTGFLESHIAWLNTQSKLKVKIAREGEKPLPGHVYYAPESYHLGLTPSGRFWYDPSPPLGSHRPSVTKMFEAIASVYGASALAMLLTGMGKDGASGLLQLAKAGSITAVQDEASSVVFGMPKEAIALGAAQHIVGLEAIPQFLKDQVIAPQSWEHV